MDFQRLAFLNRHIPEAEFKVQKAYAQSTIAGRGLGGGAFNRDGMKSGPVDRGAETLEAAQKALARLRKERAAMLAQIDLSRLDGKLRQVIELRYFKGWSRLRVAIELCCEERHVSRLLREAERILVKEVDDGKVI